MAATFILPIILPILLGAIVLIAILISTNASSLGSLGYERNKMEELTKRFKRKKKHGKSRTSSFFDPVPIYAHDETDDQRLSPL